MRVVTRIMRGESLSVRVGRRIAFLRRGKPGSKVTQAELARLAGISRSMLRKIEAGRRGVTLETLERVARALGVPADRLIADGHVGYAALMRLTDLVGKLDPEHLAAATAVVGCFAEHLTASARPPVAGSCSGDGGERTRAVKGE